MNTEQLMEGLEAAEKGAALVTGMKKQLIDKGWSDDGAERIVIHWITSNGAA